MNHKMNPKSRTVKDIAKHLDLYDSPSVVETVDWVLTYLAADSFLLSENVENKENLNWRRQFTPQEILNLGYLPQGCLSYSTLAVVLFDKVCIPAKIVRMYNETDPAMHFIVDYSDENGDWHRCDPKWEKRKDQIFFVGNPELHARFRKERLLLHGGKPTKRDSSGKPTEFKTFDFQEEVKLSF